MRLTPVAHFGLALTLTLGVVALTGCNARQEGDFYVQGSRAMVGTFYAEYFNKDNKRWYLLAKQETLEAFQSGNHEMPFSKTLIGVGPDKATVVVEQVKDADQSQIIGSRLVNEFNARKGTAIKAFAPK
jgi:hypothetical protein